MDLDRYERYEVSPAADGIHISMWQVLPRVGGGVVALVLLAAGFATDPYVGHGRIWASLGVIALGAVALFGVRVQSWLISDTAVRFKGSIWDKEVSLDRVPGKPLVVRAEQLTGDSDVSDPPCPHVIHLLGPDGLEVGTGFHFRQRSTALRFAAMLQTVGTIELDDAAVERYRD
jgi:hypothetical protein